MGLIKSITNRILGTKSGSQDSGKEKQALLRRCYFEVMEQRRVLSADPVIAAITYLEGDAGQDTTPDHFEVSFEGGAETTMLTQFTINGDQDSSGDLSDGDMFFDVNEQLPGTGGYHGFQFDAANSQGIETSDIRLFSISSDGLLLSVEVDNFESGDVFAFTIDVDEVERFRFDKIASGVEYEGTFFNAEFVDEHYTFVENEVSIAVPLQDGFVQSQESGIFFDEYDVLFDEGGRVSDSAVQLTLDNEEGNANRTAGAIDGYILVPKPVSISGNVYHDEDLDCERDADENGIEGVEISLQRLNEETGNYDQVATTTTDADGRYEFGKELNLKPGTFRLVEVQPEGYLNVGESAGSHGGDASENVIANINVPDGGSAATDYDFKEIRPASIAGNVWHDENNDGVFDPSEQGIANVLIQVTRLGAKEGVTSDPFAGTDPIMVRTDANGRYEVDALPPGMYEIVEINDYLGELDPLEDYLDGKDSIGTVNGSALGVQSNDKFSQILLCAQDHAVEFNFGELKPANLRGTVWHDSNNDGIMGSQEDPIEGVLIELFDANGNKLDEILTDEEGNYCFEDLEPGEYIVRESQPSGYLDGADNLGTVNGVAIGDYPANDEFAVTLGSGDSGADYDFGEVLPAQLQGTVWHDSNNDGQLEPGEDRLGGVVVELFDSSGQQVAQTLTDANGEYRFIDLYPGEYVVRETQPTGFQDGKDPIGQVNGIEVGVHSANDEFTVQLDAGDHGIRYDFGELKPSSISGTVHGDVNGDCVFDSTQGDIPLVGVELVLLDSDGNELDRTVTDENGDYSFDNLLPGNYSIKEITPEGLIDGAEMTGTVGTETRGETADDLFTGVILASGEQGVNYDFCEYIPASLSGTVYHDRNDNGVQDVGEEGISGTRVTITDPAGNVIAESLTNADGQYQFERLIPGTFIVSETQPEGFVDGKDAVGNVNGETRGQGTNDQLVNVTLRGGEHGVEYNFGELKLAEISGRVHIDADGNCVFDAAAGDEVLADVTLELLNDAGVVVATTTTDVAGNYQFSGILPGEYAIRESQPEGFFNGGQTAGSAGGEVSENLIEKIVVSSGQKLTNYDFCEVEAAEIHGRVWEDGPAIETQDGALPANYRSLRDGVYQSDVDTPLAGVRMELFYFIDPVNGEIAPRPVTLAEVQGEHYSHLSSDDPNTPIWVETTASGEYSFLGLQAGNYIVMETQPEGYYDSTDVPGTTTGFAFNSPEDVVTAPQSLIFQFSAERIMDAVINIRVNAGEVSSANNFSEVRVTVEPPTNQPPNPQTPQLPPAVNSSPQSPGVTSYPGLYGAQSIAANQFVGVSRGYFAPADSAPYTWHLSVVNGGLPRGMDDGAGEDSVWQQASFISNTDWTRFEMEDAVWTFAETNDRDGSIVETSKQLRFGMMGGIPLAGDFDGDGTDEVAVFKDGFWLIDINRDGRWDESDLLVRLGEAGDRPVVGDWDGDGKDDIGIYGPIWARDREAIERDPGLPNPDNNAYTEPKNIPPIDAEATNGSRVMKLTSFGKQRADVVDHVFGIGEREEIPVTGDWNGNGIRSIGTFQNGLWQLDVNGDGKFDYDDATAQFGRAGDVPVVGDFDGDGVEEIAIYRNGTWMIDSNGNRELDATDKSFQLGGALDQPVVGDWDGDGIDDPGLYTQQPNDSDIN